MNFDLLKLSVLCNSIEQMSATSEEKGEENFGIRLTHEDARMLVRGLLLLEAKQKEYDEKAELIHA